jgi:hypothetical protein
MVIGASVSNVLANSSMPTFNYNTPPPVVAGSSAISANNGANAIAQFPRIPSMLESRARIMQTQANPVRLAHIAS